MASFKQGYGVWRCPYCGITIVNNKANREQHERGNRHKRAVSERVREGALRDRDERREQGQVDRLLRTARDKLWSQGIALPPPVQQQQQQQKQSVVAGTQHAKQQTSHVGLEEREEEETEEHELPAAVDPEECARAAREHYRKTWGSEDQEAEERFVRTAREAAAREAERQRVERGEDAPVLGPWVPVQSAESEREEESQETEGLDEAGRQSERPETLVQVQCKRKRQEDESSDGKAEEDEDDVVSVPRKRVEASSEAPTEVKQEAPVFKSRQKQTGSAKRGRTIGL